MPTDTRMNQLLLVAAEALDDGRDPLDTPFLSDNEVTLDEAMGLASLLAMGARLVVLNRQQMAAGPQPVKNYAADQWVKAMMLETA